MLKTMCKVFNSEKAPNCVLFAIVFNIFHRVFHNGLIVRLNILLVILKACQVKNFIRINKIRQKLFSIFATSFSYTNCINFE